MSFSINKLCEDNKEYLEKGLFYSVINIVMALSIMSIFLIIRYFKMTADTYDKIREAYKAETQ